jgi:chromosome segregation ATPase
MKKSVLLIAVVLLLASVSTRTSAQAPSSNDVNVALIRELHDLRLAIEKLASATSRVQVLSARAGQQEQLISSLMTQLITLNGKLGESNADIAFESAILEQLKERIRIESDPAVRTALEQQQRASAAELDRKRLMQSAVQAQADALRQQISAEQSNLADIQRRLDDLDRPVVDPQK